MDRPTTHGAGGGQGLRIPPSLSSGQVQEDPTGDSPQPDVSGESPKRRCRCPGEVRQGLIGEPSGLHRDRRRRPLHRDGRVAGDPAVHGGRLLSQPAALLPGSERVQVDPRPGGRTDGVAVRAHHPLQRLSYAQIYG